MLGRRAPRARRRQSGRWPCRGSASTDQTTNSVWKHHVLALLAELKRRPDGHSVEIGAAIVRPTAAPSKIGADGKIKFLTDRHFYRQIDTDAKPKSALCYCFFTFLFCPTKSRGLSSAFLTVQKSASLCDSTNYGLERVAGSLDLVRLWGLRPLLASIGSRASVTAHSRPRATAGTALGPV